MGADVVTNILQHITGSNLGRWSSPSTELTGEESFDVPAIMIDGSMRQSALIHKVMPITESEALDRRSWWGHGRRSQPGLPQEH
jgi:hypothetical protein